MASPKQNIPKANSLMGSLRSMGYTFESAIADIIDNSITAKATAIRLYFPTSASDCYVSIIDNGCGMSKEELFNAMRYGSTSCEDTRDDFDLGRFGLGMKSASLSQCRKLSVISRINGKTSAYQWDYNYILRKNDWLLLELTKEEYSKLPKFDLFDELNHGTMVVWQDFDIIEKASNGQIYSTLNEYKETTSNYLSLIFHRFINDNRVSIGLNNYIIEGLDPFLECKKNKVTRFRPFTLVIPDNKEIEREIIVEPIILPYASDLTKKEIKLLGGIDNLRTKQGFYIYRNDRLIIWGTWFGQQRSELTKNARIKVDIPNSLDDIWKIDIKKQNATIPGRIKNQLKRAVYDVMNTSVRQQKHRGREEKVNSDIDYIWKRLECRGNYYYEINRDSKMLDYIKHHVSDEAYQYFEMFIDEIEQNIPLQQIYIDKSANSAVTKEAENRDVDILQKAIMMIDFATKAAGMTDEKAINQIMKSEPFCNSPKLEVELKKYYLQ